MDGDRTVEDPTGDSTSPEEEEDPTFPDPYRLARSVNLEIRARILGSFSSLEPVETVIHHGFRLNSISTLETSQIVR